MRVSLLERHLEFARSVTPPEDVHALDIDGLLDPEVTFFSLREGDIVLGIGAIKRLDDTHYELKSIHTAEEARGRGVGRAVVEHLLEVATDRGAARVSLETGAQEEFAASRALYARLGFVEKVGSLVGAGSHAVKKDLENFKEFIETRGAETGGWRGDVDA